MPGELPTPDPHRRFGGLHLRRLAHLHDRRLYASRAHDIAAHPAHRNAITDLEG